LAPDRSKSRSKKYVAENKIRNVTFMGHLGHDKVAHSSPPLDLPSFHHSPTKHLAMPWPKRTQQQGGIASDIGALPELVIEGVNGTLVPPETPRPLPPQSSRSQLI